MSKKIKIIGAGLFGCCIAKELVKDGNDVTLIEKGSDIMQGASKYNHNRIHFGYHYPRSVDTAKQSLEGLVSFLMEFRDSIVSGFPNYYMVSKRGSNVTPQEYVNFCNEVGIGYDFKYPNSNMINKDKINLSIKVNEVIYDYDILKEIVKDGLNDVNLKLNTEFNGDISGYDYIINTSYANINKINNLMGAPELNLKFQDVIIPIFKMEHERLGLTVMDGPFCSIMPRGKNPNEFLLYNAKYSIISERFKNDFNGVFKVPCVNNIYKHSAKYFPFLSEVEECGWWRTIRALPINDNDSRLSEIFMNKNHPKIINVLSGKISTCCKVAFEIKHILNGGSKREIIV